MPIDSDGSKDNKNISEDVTNLWGVLETFDKDEKKAIA
jgi:hypothetical protein